MTFYTHSVFGVFLSIILLEVLNLIGLVEILLFGSAALKLFAGAILGALAPDLDQRNSKLSRYLPFLSWFIKKIGIKHRGFTHSVLGFYFVSVVSLTLSFVVPLDEILVYGFLVGYLSHITIDLFNPGGVKLFFPCKRKYRLGKISVGSRSENSVLFFIGLFLILIIYYESDSLDSLISIFRLLRSNL